MTSLTQPARGQHTKERLLDAAETLFAERGIKATSLRQITARASANLAAVNYHFNSKEALTQAVFTRRLDPLNGERLRLLGAAEKASGDSPVTLETTLHAFLDPTVKLWTEAPAFMLLLGRLEFEADEKLHGFYLTQFEEVLIRFKAAVTRALPDVPMKDLFWRIHFLLGAMVHAVTCHADLEWISGGLCQTQPFQEMVDRLVAFGVTGLRATPLYPEGNR
jgi:AcrR family transcriptional regulator